MITKDTITELVCERLSLDRQSLLCNNRRQKYVKARFIAMYLCRIYRLGSLAEIGDYFNKDHSTVIYAIKKVKDMVDIYPADRVFVYKLMDKLGEVKIPEPGLGMYDYPSEEISAENLSYQK